MKQNFRTNIITDPKIMVGKPIIKGTRIPVDAIIKRIAEGMTIEEILKDYPNLTKRDIKTALEYAMNIIRGEDIIPFIVDDKKYRTLKIPG